MKTGGAEFFAPAFGGKGLPPSKIRIAVALRESGLRPGFQMIVGIVRKLGPKPLTPIGRSQESGPSDQAEFIVTLM